MKAFCPISLKDTRLAVEPDAATAPFCANEEALLSLEVM
jgi:hypothetical protein